MTTLTFDFSSPATTTPPNGAPWKKPGDVDLSLYYPGLPAPLYLASSSNCKATTVYVDQGVILEATSNDTTNIEAFGLCVQLPSAGHDRQIRVVAEFDLVEVKKTGQPFQGAVTADVIAADRLAGEIHNSDKMAHGTCQLRFDHVSGPGPDEPKFRLNAPDSTGGGAFNFTAFDFFHPLQKPSPLGSSFLAFSNNGTIPLKLELILTASSAGSGQPAGLDVALTQKDDAAIKSFVSKTGSNSFKCNAGTFTDSLGIVSFAGPSLAITQPPNVTGPTNAGPIKARIRKMIVDYS